MTGGAYSMGRYCPILLNLNEPLDQLKATKALALRKFNFRTTHLACVLLHAHYLLVVMQI
jgi:hypothetical protein